jgi:predicted nucleotidyltransferase
MIWVVPHLSALLLFFLHTNRDRGSQDLDFIINYDITDEELRRKGYIKYRDRKNGYSTPRRTIFVDIYKNMNEAISGIPIRTIINTAEKFEINAKRGRINEVKAAKLEVLIVMKYNARRSQDTEDLETLALRSRREIDWDHLKNIINDEYHYGRIRVMMQM